MPPKKSAPKSGKGKGGGEDEDPTDEVVGFLDGEGRAMQDLVMAFCSITDLVALALKTTDAEFRHLASDDVRRCMVQQKAQDDYQHMVPYLGLHYLPEALAAARELQAGVVLTEVFWNTPAQLSGLEAGDIITELNTKPVHANSLKRMLRVYCPGDAVTMRVRRPVTHTINTLLSPTYGGGKPDSAKRVEARAARAASTLETIRLSLVVGALDYTGEEVAACRRLAQGGATSAELGRLSRLACRCERDPGPSKYSQGPDPAPPPPEELRQATAVPQSARSTLEGVAGDEDVEAGPPPVPTMPLDPPGTGRRALRLSRKLLVTPGPSVVNYVSSQLERVLGKELATIDQHQAALGEGREVLPRDFGQPFEAV